LKDAKEENDHPEGGGCLRLKQKAHEITNKIWGQKIKWTRKMFVKK
jgi:hypothetical protein